MNLSANDGEGHARILSGAALLQQTKHRWDHTPIPSQLNARAKVGIELVNLRTINRKRHLRRTRLFFYIPRTVARCLPPAACRLPPAACRLPPAVFPALFSRTTALPCPPFRADFERRAGKTFANGFRAKFPGYERTEDCPPSSGLCLTPCFRFLKGARGKLLQKFSPQNTVACCALESDERMQEIGRAWRSMPGNPARDALLKFQKTGHAISCSVHSMDPKTGGRRSSLGTLGVRCR